MSDVVNRTTNQYLRSVHEPDYPLVDWLHDPDLSAVTGYGSQYWVITGDVVTLMDQAARDAVDAQILSDTRDAIANELDQLEGGLRALTGSILDELNAHALKLNAILDAIDGAGNLNEVKTAIAAITDYPQRTIAQVKTVFRNWLGN